MDPSSEPTTSEATDAAGVAPAAGTVEAGDAAGHETDSVITEALVVIDQSLAQMVGRELVSGGEVADLLLDLRTALTATPQNA